MSDAYARVGTIQASERRLNILFLWFIAGRSAEGAWSHRSPMHCLGIAWPAGTRIGLGPLQDQYVHPKKGRGARCGEGGEGSPVPLSDEAGVRACDAFVRQDCAWVRGSGCSCGVIFPQWYACVENALVALIIDWGTRSLFVGCRV